MARNAKTKNLALDASRGALNIWASTSALVSEKSIISVQTTLRRNSKKLGIVWTKPVHIKTTTAKGEKRLGKGKGAVISYNRTATMSAGACVFELGSVTDFSNKASQVEVQLRAAGSKLPFNVKIERRAGLETRLKRSGVVHYNLIG